MKVYIITTGCYSDYSIRAVFTTKEKAEEVFDLYSDTGKYIEEWDADLEQIEHPVGCKLYYVCIEGGGEARAYQSESFNSAGSNRYNGAKYNSRTLYLWAESEEHAIKIANEDRLMRIASGTFEQ
jgi:hypothetical protein